MAQAGILLCGEVGSGQVELWRLDTWRYCEGCLVHAARYDWPHPERSEGGESGKSRGAGDSGSFAHA